MSLLAERTLYGISKPLIGTYTGAMLNMDIQMHDSFPDGAKIIAANHPSTTDPFFVAWLLKRQSFILIKDTLFNVPILGAYLRASGHIQVKAGDGQLAIDAAVEHLKRGHTVVIFPEGKVSPITGGFNPVRSGIGRIALASGAPVIPVGIFLDRSLIHSVPARVKGKDEIGHWYWQGPYNMTVGSAESFTGSPDDWERVREVSDKVMHKIMDLSYESQNRQFRKSRIIAGFLASI